MRLFLVDGMAQIYRAHFAMIKNPLITKDGRYTSAVFGFFIALPGLITYGYADIENLPKYSLGYVNVPIVISIALTSIFTAPLGAKLSKKINSKLLKKIFAIFLLFTCLSLLINQLF